MQPSFYQTRSHIKSFPVVCQVKLLKQAAFPMRIHGSHKKHDGHWIIPIQSNVHFKTRRTCKAATPPFFGWNVVLAITNLQGLVARHSVYTVEYTHRFWNMTHHDDCSSNPEMKQNYQINIDFHITFIQLPTFPPLNELLVVTLIKGSASALSSPLCENRSLWVTPAGGSKTLLQYSRSTNLFIQTQYDYVIKSKITDASGVVWLKLWPCCCHCGV